MAAGFDILPGQNQDLSLDRTSVLVNGAGYAVLGAFFLAALPWWQPLAWIALCNLALWVRRCYMLCPTVTRSEGRELAWALRWSHWGSTLCAGSAAYWLFVPNNPLMQGVLAIALVSIATIVVLETVGDIWRTAVSLCLVLLPGATRFLLQPDWISTLYGIGGFFTIPALLLMWQRQQGVWRRQFSERQRAEQAVDALAHLSLEKARFFAAASHDLRQPVHALGLYVATLESLTLPEAAQPAIHGIRLAWADLADQLNQLLDIARADSGNVTPRLESIDLGPYLKQLAHAHQARAMAHAQRIIVLQTCAGACHAQVDRVLLTRVLSNLIDNALKFAPAGSSIVLSVRRGANATWRVQIRDAGPGIASEQQASVFNEFVQLDHAAHVHTGGVGLGLAIVRRFTELLGGEITLWARPGRGSVFQLRLPRAGSMPAQAPASAQPGTVTSARLHASQRLILLEDDPRVLSAMQGLAASWQISCLATSRPEDALAWARGGDVALCDIRLPGSLSGLDVALQLRRRGLGVALLTGENDPILTATAHQEALLLLQKPLTADVIRRTLEQLGLKSSDIAGLQATSPGTAQNR